MEQIVRPFSAGYYMLNASVMGHSGETVIMPSDLYRELVNYVTEPLLRIDNEHYWPSAEKTVPAETIAVPTDVSISGSCPVLLAKDETAGRLIGSGKQARPT